MVAQIGPLVQAGDRFRIAANHIAGGMAGGLTIGVVFGLCTILLHVVLAWPRSVIVVVLGLVLAGAFAADASLVRIRPLGLRRQTPRSWSCSFGEAAGAFAWGFDLGLALTTRLTTYAVVVLPVFAVLSGSFLLTCLVFFVYGTARAAVVVGVAARSKPAAIDLSRHLGENQATLLRLAAVASLVTAGTIVAVWL
jgi:hypothetical protein